MFEDDVVVSGEDTQEEIPSVEEDEVDIDESFDPEEESEEGGLSVGACVAGGGIIAGLALGGVLLYKKVRNSEKVQSMIDNAKQHRELRKEVRATIKTIKSEAKGKIDAVRHPKVEEPAPSPAPETPANTDGTTKSKKK